MIISYLVLRQQTFPTKKCGFDHKHNALLQNLAYKNLIEKSEAEIKQYRLNQNKSSQIYNIPVVVHVLHMEMAPNISDAQINSAISHLNQARTDSK